MIKIDQNILTELTKKAKSSDRLRVTRNYHPEASDRLQRMLNAIEPGSYVQPHKHENPDKREIFVILSGRVLVLEFDNEGTTIDQYILDRATGNISVEIPARVWHSIISLESGSVVFEIKDGPYNPDDDKNFAGWAPTEGDANCTEYMNRLLEKTIGKKQP